VRYAHCRVKDLNHRQRVIVILRGLRCQDKRCTKDATAASVEWNSPGDKRCAVLCDLHAKALASLYGVNREGQTPD